MSTSIQVEIWRLPVLTGSDILAMENLYRTYYIGAEETAFYHDIQEKDFVIILRAASTICGFSTIRLLNISGIDVLFSGDTIVDEPHRSQTGLAGGFGHIMKMLAQTYPLRNFHWFLISKGARTYRFLPTFFKQYVPGTTEIPELTDKLRSIAAAMFPNEFNPETGVLHFSGCKDRLINDSLRGDCHSVFFRQKNPNWHLGDELCCLASLSMNNLNALGMRVINSVTPIWKL